MFNFLDKNHIVAFLVVSHDSIRGSVRPFGSPKMLEIELGAAKGVSERQGGQRLDDRVGIFYFRSPDSNYYSGYVLNPIWEVTCTI